MRTLSQQPIRTVAASAAAFRGPELTQHAGQFMHNLLTFSLHDLGVCWLRRPDSQRNKSLYYSSILDTP